MARRERPCIPTRVRPEPPRISYAHLLSAVMLSNWSQGEQVRDRDFAGELFTLGALQERHVRPSEGDARGPAHFHAPKRMRTEPRADSVSEEESAIAGFNEAERAAFRTAFLFRAFSSAFRFCDSSAYAVVDVADFIARPLRNRALKDATLARVSILGAEFYLVAVKHEPPMPVCGDESLVAVENG